MTLPGTDGRPSVTILRPTVAAQITFPAVTSEQIVTTTIAVPLAYLTEARVFMPPGVNYSVQIQLGFSGRVEIPTKDSDDWIIGSGFVHRYPWNAQVQSQINVWARCNNTFPHTISFELEMDYQPIQAAADRRRVGRLLL